MSQQATERPQQPSPVLFFETVNAYERSHAIKAAIELELFTAIGEGKRTIAEIAERCKASQRGIRILADYLAMLGFISKRETAYELTQDSAVFLNKQSPAYIGGAIEFLFSPTLREAFENLTEAVRKGGTAVPDGGTVAPENPVWVKFARGMAPLMGPAAEAMQSIVDVDPSRKIKVLDIAAGHGMFGIAFARHNQNVEVKAVDWPNVLEVAKQNAAAAGVASRYSTIPGSAFDVDFGNDYDLVLLTNFLHHFDIPTCEKLLRKVHDALADGGRAITLEFVPNDDRISPPESAGFSIVMLAGTPAGDAYTFKQLDQMFRNAGFGHSDVHRLEPFPQTVLVSHR